MADAVFGAPARACNPPSCVFDDIPQVGPDDPSSDVAGIWLTPTTLRLMTAVFGDSGSVAVSELVSALPVHPRPLSAICELLDAGRAALDPGAPFGADAVVSLLLTRT
jgi:hypothetical protein